MTVEYLDLADYVAIAAAVTGLDLQTVMNMTNLNLADSALHAPAAGFGEDEFYPAKQPFSSCGWHATIRCPTATSAPLGSHCDSSSKSSTGPGNPTPSIDDAEAAVLAVAAGNWVEDTTSTWLRRHLQPVSTDD